LSRAAAESDGPDLRDDDPFLHRFLPGPSAAFRELRSKVRRLNLNVGLVGFVLLVGETGTGKNHVARVIAGHRRWLVIKDNPEELDPGRGCPDGIAELDRYTTRLGEMVLSVVTETMAASELFGHVKGSFTDARRDHPGLFGDDGYDDVLLDEIGEAPAVIQAKLLGVLEGRGFVPLGGTSGNRRPLKSRILMATNRDLRRMVAESEFRQDLFFRIRRHVILVPPLRAHIEDLPGIAATIVDRLCTKDPKRAAHPRPTLAPSDIDWAKRQPWGGNIREIEEVIEQWLLGDARESLEIVAGRRQYGDANPGTGPEHDIATRVRRTIEEILDDRRRSPGTFSRLVGTFTGEIEDAVTRALVSWYRERRPDQATLKRLFPDMTWSSIKSVLSRARKR
jgi:transcriptional regulator with GAF, ATPase, and Fis domain